jgi:long-chain fatty acid transport protein
MRNFVWAVLTAYLAFTLPALAAGYGLREFSAGAMSTAFAGSSATQSDASYQAYNPASLAGVADTDYSFTVSAILPSSSASYSTALTSAGTPVSGNANPKNFISSAVIPELALRKRLSDHWVAGIALYAPWGLSTNYPANFAGRYYALQSKLMTVNITPSVSYEITPAVAIAAGIQIEYAKGRLSSAVDIGTLGASFRIPGSIPGQRDGGAVLSASDWATGFTLGVIAHPWEGTTAGLSYRSAINNNLRGTINYTLDPTGVGAVIKAATGTFTNSNGSAKLSTPDSINFGVRTAISPQWTALFELDWTNWKKFQQLQIVSSNPVQPNDVTLANWKTGLFGSAGLEYRPGGPLTWKAGVAYDQSPIPSSTLAPRIPDAPRTLLAVGGSYQMNPDTDITLSYEHLFIPGRQINQTPAQTGNSLRGYLAGTTQSSVDAVALQIAYRTN